jgi:hypothetical protein
MYWAGTIFLVLCFVFLSELFLKEEKVGWAAVFFGLATMSATILITNSRLAAGIGVILYLVGYLFYLPAGIPRNIVFNSIFRYRWPISAMAVGIVSFVYHAIVHGWP